MAVTENLYTGNGSATNYSFTFPYLETTDIKVSINGTITTAYTLANPTTIQFTTAPANGAAIRIYRVTDDSALAATFYSGAAIRATDLNDNFTQNLYVTQESNREATSATTSANSAISTANTALSTANAATATANAASASAASAVSTAASAVSTANSAVSTANAASASAASAVSTANTANANSAAALNAAAEALAYVIVANVAAIPGSPVNGDAVRVTNSTGIESFTPLSGVPGGFVGDSGLTVEIYYSSSTSSWVWVRYFAGDPENRYASAADMTQAQSDILGLDTQKLDVTTAASTYLTQSNAASTYQPQSGMSSYLTTSAAGLTYAPLSSPTFIGSIQADNYLTPAVGAFFMTNDTRTGMNIRGTGNHYVAFNTDNVERARLDASGRLGLGTSSPTAKLTLAGNGISVPVTLTDAATITVDMSLSNHFVVTLGGNRTLGAPTNVVAGQSGVIRVVQDGTGSRTLAYNSVFKFPGGTAPTLTTTANAVDLLAYHVESTTRIAVRFIGDVK